MGCSSISSRETWEKIHRIRYDLQYNNVLGQLVIVKKHAKMYIIQYYLIDMYLICRLDIYLNLSQDNFVGNEFSYDSQVTYRPYKWAQYVAGLDFLPGTLNDLKEANNGVENKNELDSFLNGKVDMDRVRKAHQEGRAIQLIKQLLTRYKTQLSLT